MRTVIMIYEEIPEHSRVFIFRHISEDKFNKLLSFNNVFVGRDWNPKTGYTEEEYKAKEQEIAEFFFDSNEKFLFENEEITTPIKNINVDAIIRTGYLVA